MTAAQAITTTFINHNIIWLLITPCNISFVFCCRTSQHLASLNCLSGGTTQETQSDNELTFHPTDPTRVDGFKSANTNIITTKPNAITRNRPHYTKSGIHGRFWWKKTSSGMRLTNGGILTSDTENNNILLQSVIASDDCSTAELALLAKLEEANRLIEADAKSLNSLSGASVSGHSRKSSDTSQISLTSGTSSSQERGEDEEDLWTIWGRIVNDWDNFWKKRNAWVRELVRKGVPHHFRGIVWQLLCSAHDSPDKKQYADYIKATSACEKVIRRDIARTYPEHDFFKEKDGMGQESLFNVMKAYSLHDREVGYCQGSGFIVGLLLMQMPEEEAFAVLVKLMQEYRMRDMFKPSMAELGVCMFQLENMVQEQLPELHVHFQSQSFHTSMYASSWFLTLFTTALSLPLACRIMDVFLSEGMEIIFKVAIAMLMLGKEDLLCLDMEGMLKVSIFSDML